MGEGRRRGMRAAEYANMVGGRRAGESAGLECESDCAYWAQSGVDPARDFGRRFFAAHVGVVGLVYYRTSEKSRRSVVQYHRFAQPADARRRAADRRHI